MSAGDMRWESRLDRGRGATESEIVDQGHATRTAGARSSGWPGVLETDLIRLRLFVRTNRTATPSLSSRRNAVPRYGRLAAPADERMTMARTKKDDTSH